MSWFNEVILKEFLILLVRYWYMFILSFFVVLIIDMVVFKINKLFWFVLCKLIFFFFILYLVVNFVKLLWRGMYGYLRILSNFFFLLKVLLIFLLSV